MINLLIADDHPIVREGLKRIVNDCPDMQLVGEAVNGHEAIELSKTSPPDVILLDLTMPGPGFLETLRRLKSESPATRVLVLSIHPEDQYAVRALKAGAAGYLTKDHSAGELASAIRRVHSGARFMTLTLAEKLATRGVNDGEVRPRHEDLSGREFQVMSMLGSGTSATEIAAKLKLSPKTVSTYRMRIFQKMGFKSNADLIRYAVLNDLVDWSDQAVS